MNELQQWRTEHEERSRASEIRAIENIGACRASLHERISASERDAHEKVKEAEGALRRKVEALEVRVLFLAGGGAVAGSVAVTLLHYLLGKL